MSMTPMHPTRHRTTAVRPLIILLLLLLGAIGASLAQKPQLVYSTLLGGSSMDYGHAIAVDDSGCAFVAGQAGSWDYPTTGGAFDRTENGSADILVTKLNPAGSALIYSTFIGGSGDDDTRKIFVDKSGCVYLTGGTQSSNFPTTAGSLAGAAPSYFLKLDATGSHLLYASRWAGGERILVDTAGYVIIVGNTDSASFPTTEHAYARTHGGGKDVIVAKIDIRTNAVVFSTFLGGSGNDFAFSAALDDQGNIVIVGSTTSANFPILGTSYASPVQGKSDVFVTKLSSDGTHLLFSTTVGGSDDDWPFDVAVGPGNDLWVTGGTRSGDFPASPSAVLPAPRGGDDAFVFRLAADASHLVYATYLGGTGQDGGRGIVVDKRGRAYVTGCTRSPNFPTTPDAFDSTYNGAGSGEWVWGDTFLAVLSPGGTRLDYGTFLGGTADEEAYGIALDSRRGVYLCGITSSANFVTTEGAFSRTIKGGCAIYAAKFQFPPDSVDIEYFGQTPPGDLPVRFPVFPPSGNWPLLHSCPAFSPAGDEAFWAVWPDPATSTQSLYRRTMKDGTWNDPSAVPFTSNQYSDKLPCFNGDGTRVYFTSDRPRTGSGAPGDENVWYIEKADSGWSAPACLDSAVNTDRNEGWISLAANNNLYFGRDDSLYFAEWDQGHYRSARPLPINPGLDVLGCIAPDERYMIFQSRSVLTRTGSWDNDLYIVLRIGAGWSQPIALSTAINAMPSKSFARISPDGRYLFFLGDGNDAYWVNTDFVRILTEVSPGHPDLVPVRSSLAQNYPNPFNPRTMLGYGVRGTGPLMVRLAVYDMLGREIAILVNESKAPGTYIVPFDGSQLSSGVYVYRLTAGGSSEARTMVLVR